MIKLNMTNFNPGYSLEKDVLAGHRLLDSERFAFEPRTAPSHRTEVTRQSYIHVSRKWEIVKIAATNKLNKYVRLHVCHVAS
jgi:hypothetical protein